MLQLLLFFSHLQEERVGILTLAFLALYHFRLGEHDLRKSWLRSWVQLPPGPYLPVLELRYYFEFDFNNCRTNLAAIPILLLVDTLSTSIFVANLFQRKNGKGIWERQTDTSLRFILT